VVLSESADRTPKDAANKPRLRKLVWVERREVPLILQKRMRQDEYGRAFSALHPLILRGDEEAPRKRGRDYGLPGAAKNAGAFARLFENQSLARST
jgi:hypothetical protein